MDKKLSFSLSSKSSSSDQQTLKTSHLFNDNDDQSNDADTSCHYITEFNDDSSNETPKLAIPPIQNQFWPSKMTESLNLPSNSASAASSIAEIREGLNIRQSRTPINGDCEADQRPKQSIDSIMCGLNIRKSRIPFDGECEAESQGSKESKKLKADLDSLPDDEGSQQFEEVPVEGFGAALMAGYGWKQGMGIGRNVQHDVEVVKYKPWNGRQGLGARIDS